jgi:uncharacterized protein (UPF0276 family)
MHTLPSLGLGLSSNAQHDDQPRPYALLDEQPGAFDYLEYSAPLSLDEARRHASLFPQMLARRGTVPLLFHPVHLNLFGPTLERAENLEALKAHCLHVGSPWVSNDVAWWHSHGHSLPGSVYIAPPLNEWALRLAEKHAQVIQQAVGIPLLLENPVVMTARGNWHVLDFLERLSTATECWMLLDVGHLLAHQLARGRGLFDGLLSFDFARVAQLHVAGGIVTERHGRLHYVDDHPQPVRDEVWQLLEFIAPRCRHLRAVTFEGDGHSDRSALRNLERLRAWAPRKQPFPMKADDVGTQKGVAGAMEEADAGLCWALFHEVHRGESRDDAAGALHELEFRQAVVGELLERVAPWTHLAVLASRTSVADFLASPQFRFAFETSGDLRSAYVAFARERLEDPGSTRLVDFDAWAWSTVERHRQPYRTGLAPGVCLAAFSWNLSEVISSARSVERHVRGRALYSDGVSVRSGLSSVVQAAGRAPFGPWTVALRRTPTRIEVHEVSAAEQAILERLSTGETTAVSSELAKSLLRKRLVTVAPE